MAFRFRKDFINYIRTTAEKKGLSQVEFLEACVTVGAKDVPSRLNGQPKITFKFKAA